MRPIIGFTLDYEEGGPTAYSKYPWYGLRDNYTASVARHGAVPIALPHEVEAVDAYLDLMHGLVITGGNFDVPPEMYGEKTSSATVTTKPRRSQFEWAVTHGALARGLPILGICGGQQLLNVILGGSLIQHIPDSVKHPLAHEQPNPRHEAGHEVAIVAGTLLSGIVGSATLAVNSAHHQAVGKTAEGVIVNARAGDGVIEGIEYPAHPFCLGVQWHPEFSISRADDKIFAAFVAAARIYGQR
ncbi:MAG: gamma-glutamyl-gamma-aminobutyrate hydrolase family protein [Alphaproteobacteria bacterium]|nr:gamma-glutamyl-gamma-aminobutyrate hydrolase family protein [Alphaproteobacteria bacterium]